MADAKINLETFTNDEGLKRLNSALAEGAQAAAAMQKELRDLEKATQSGTNATAEQAKAMQDLREKLTAQKQVNAEYNKAIKETVHHLGNVEEKHSALETVLNNVAGKLGINTAAFTSLDVAAGMFAGTLATKVAGALAQFVQDVAAMGAAAEKSAAVFAAWKPAADDAAQSLVLFNTVGRDTNYDLSAVKQWGMDLVNLGYSANNAARMIKLCADTAAGLGKGQAGAETLIRTLARIQATGQVSSRQMKELQQSGLDMDKAFESVGMTAEEAMDAMDDGTLNAQDAVASLTDYMHTFDGSMAESKQNIIDEWGDVEGNMTTICASIGGAIFEAFDKSGIVQTLIDFTQDLLDLVWSDGTSAFSEFASIGQWALDVIDDGLEVVRTAIKAVIVIFYKLNDAARSIGSAIAGYLAPILRPLQAIWDKVKSIVSTLGGAVQEYVGTAWDELVGPRKGVPKEYNEDDNHFHTAVRAPKEEKDTKEPKEKKEKLTEEQRQIEALIKKYSDWIAIRQANEKAAIEEMKVRATMLTGEAKADADRAVKLAEYKKQYDDLIDSYEKEIKLAEGIENDETRQAVADRISEQERNAKELYMAQIEALQYAERYKQQQANSKELMATFGADPNSVKAYIDAIKTTVTDAMAEIDQAMATAGEDQEAGINGLAKVLGMSPEAIKEELATKNETLQEFVDSYKQKLVDAGEAETNQVKNTKSWKDAMVSYWQEAGKSMGEAFSSILTGTKSASAALGDFVKTIFQNALKIATEWLGLFAIYSIVGDPKLAARWAGHTLFGMDFGGVTKGKFGFATGGYVAGPGTGTSDSIPAMLSNGEYVITSQAVNRIGRDNLDAINAGRVPDLGSSGGVTAISGGNVTLNVSAVDASGFSAFLQRGGLDAIKQALFDNNRNFAADSGVW
ncbi:phage tail tape measure protein [Acidaminococcus timonensis]|uniref:hypothetical protein n=1 Tax=Acidaminococcus timonensis TaxID=1871002 RepID=UPI0008DB2FBC|nr:hypothetical protein [Acidaminococcus timonensis]